MTSFFYKLFVFICLLFTIPWMIAISVVLVLTSGFPVFFLQKRIGKDGKAFTLFKFRTMVPNAADQQASLKKINEAKGPVFKIYDDPRFTPFGKFLNHTGLDELPQFFNVFFGTMAIIGPRPLPLNEAKKLQKWQHQRESVLPGIISPWVLEGYHRTTFDAWMKSDVAYAQQKSLRKDWGLFFRFLTYWKELILVEIVQTIHADRSTIDKQRKKQYT